MSGDRSRWLSEGAETLVREVEADVGTAFQCEVLIVGSGYGGAVAAARLAGARPTGGGEPVSVYVLERGQEYLPGSFPAGFAELPGHVRFSQQNGRPARGRAEGLFDLRLGDDVNVLLGNGLGGGSLINAAVMERADAAALNDPRWPGGSSLDAGYLAAEKMLVPQTLPGSVPKLDSLLAAGAAMGASEARRASVAVAFTDQTTPAGVSMRKCLKCGDCVTGCNHQAKQSLDVNYLAMARANGARLFCGATVQRVTMHGEGFAAEFFFTDPAKARTDRARPYVLRARRVILAAGTLGSTEILLRSHSAQLPIADTMLGKQFSANGDLIAVAYRQKAAAPSCAKEGDVPADRNIGPTITGLLRVPQPNGRRPLVIEEFAIPAPLRRVFGEVVATTDALHGLTCTDRSRHTGTERMDDPLSVSDAALDHTPVYGMMGDDGADGAIEFTDGPPGADGQVKIAWMGVGRHEVFKAQMAALRSAHERLGGRGGRVLPNPQWQTLPPSWPLSVPGAVTTVHPLGGVPMGRDRDSGMVDAMGRVYAADGEPQATLTGLAVLDGSIVPVSLGINPALTIAALAERAVPLLAGEWDLALRDADRPQTTPRPRRRDLSRPAAPQPTRVSLHERMTGTIVIDNRRYAAELVADFAPVDVPALRTLPRIVAQPSVALTLTALGEPKPQTWQLTCSGQAEVLVRERSNVLTRVMRSIDLVRRRLGSIASAADAKRIPLDLVALCSHLGAARLIRYDWTVTDAADDAPFGRGQRLRLTKRIAFGESGNPWRQLSEGRLDRLGAGGTVALGPMVLDLAFFAEQLTPLLRIETQQDQPNALADIAELALWAVRVVLRIHLLNLLPNGAGAGKPVQRLPGDLPGLARKLFDVLPELPPDPRLAAPPCRVLTRYVPAERPLGTSRPVLLIHGYGAGGSTFAHPSIPNNLVQTLCATGREVWVLELRTSIGLEQRVYWSFDDVAREDIPHAVQTLLAATTTPADGKVDVVAHCIGAAMFSVAVLESPGLHLKIGSAVLSQVGPLLRMSAFNRFRGFVASYLKQFIGIEQFDVVAADSGATATLLIDALLATFPYPDDDHEAERLQTVPDFARARHRADAIFGQTMQLANIGDATLGALADIYGWVMVEGLAQTIHYAREFLLTDVGGANRVVAFAEISQRLTFPLLMVHGRKNALFDWRGSYDTVRLLRQVIDDEDLPAEPAHDPVFETNTARRLLLLDDYGHQDTLIGEHAHRDVFPPIVAFLDEFGRGPPNRARGDPPLVAELPWMGPMLGRVKRNADELTCRLLLRPPPARAATLAVVYVPARRNGAAWDFLTNHAVMATLDDDFDDVDDPPVARVQVVRLAAGQLAEHQGFAVLTVHNDLPLRRVARIGGVGKVGGLFIEPDDGLPADIRKAVAATLAGPAERVDLAVVHLDPAWLQAVQHAGQAPQGALTLALASCQYPPGLADRVPAQRSLERLARHVAEAPVAVRPQALLLMGDQVYVDGTAGLFAPSIDAVENAYRLNFTLPALRRVTKALPVCPMLDDHEVEDNWEPEFPLTGAHAAALRGWRSHQYRLLNDSADDHAGPYDSVIAPAGLPMFLLDVRSTRQRRALRTSDGAVPLDDAGLHAQAELADLLAALRDAPADVPKFIVTSTTVFPFPLAALGGSGAERLGLDDWNGYPRSLFALLDAIRRERIANVVLLSGDRHMSSVSSLWLDADGSPIEVISIVSSGLYAPWPFVNSRPDEFLLDGELKWQHRDRSLTGAVVTAATGTADGFAVVRVERASMDGGIGKWHIDVRLDLTDGVRRCGRVIGDGRDRGWTMS